MSDRRERSTRKRSSPTLKARDNRQTRDERRHRERSRSPQRHTSRRSRSRSYDREEGQIQKRRRSRSPSGVQRSKPQAQPEQNSPKVEKNVEPNFGLSGALAAETNLFRGVVLKYNEPPEARKPNKNWRLYAFKNGTEVELYHLSQQSAYLIGRDKAVADIEIQHPSASKQHAVIQFRRIVERSEFGDEKFVIKPFIIDLESANGTRVNEEEIPQSRFYELKTSDIIKFASSTREYVLLMEP